MASAGAKDAGEELREQLRDLFKVLRPLRHQVAQGELAALSPGLVGVLSTVEKVSVARAGAGGCHSKDLADRFAVNPSTISRAVGALVRHGLVRREEDPTDKRAHFLTVTDAGRAILATADRWYDEMFRDTLSRWSPDDVTAFIAMLRRFTNELDGYLDRCPARRSCGPESDADAPELTGPELTGPELAALN
ncbi:MarR family transcriptional regulator [Micromonospora polyrhachis]|uniref:DNA-binding MarR family transcriptional regulator n=1 Tax=Micromonospora polyrhachis TaxID=1282883 RepID=A0A7W7WS54_9ACTN|nr:MarR family winged helix-turn-helix transcriptional regulator [Micromonospora polyrhachis]MBB4961951.1 DNA-binding MarR family transcriptional regulator [Micromonospora polyrhachis]